MHGYFFTAVTTRTQTHLTSFGFGRRACNSAIVCADTSEAARKRFEEWLCAPTEGETGRRTRIDKTVAAQFIDQLLTEKEFIPINWPQIAREAQSDLQSTPVDDFEQGYWLDVNTIGGSSSSLEALRGELPEDIRSGLNWAEDKQFLFLLSVLTPSPPLPESGDEPEAGAPEDTPTPGSIDDDPAPDLRELEADYPQLVDKEVAAVIRARNSAVAAWLWRKYAATTKLADHQIRIDPWCWVLGLDAKDDPDGTIEDCTKAIELNPDDADAYYTRSGAKFYKGDLDGAMADCTKSVELKPGDAKAYFTLGYLKSKKGDLDGAIVDYNKAIALNPDDAGAYYNRSLQKSAKGDLEGATADCTKAMELEPGYEKDCSCVRAHLKHEQGDLDGAMADYTKAIGLDPKYALAFEGRGCLRYDSRAFTDALLDFHKVLELDTSRQDDAQFRIWMIRARLGEEEAATVELEAYLDGRNTGKPDDWLFKIGRFLTGQLAEPEFLAAANNNPDQKTDPGRGCQAYFYAGTKHLFAGDNATAADYFQKSIATNARGWMEYFSALAELKFLNARK